MRYTIVLYGKEHTNYIETLTEEKKNEILRDLQGSIFSSFRYEVIRVP
jgi:hypothetical protein